MCTIKKAAELIRDQATAKGVKYPEIERIVNLGTRQARFEEVVYQLSSVKVNVLIKDLLTILAHSYLFRTETRSVIAIVARRTKMGEIWTSDALASAQRFVTSKS